MQTRFFVRAIAAACLFLSGLAAADFPQADISNGVLKARIYLPDAERGYYQGTRFDWSGQVASLEYKGHNYFGKWFDRYDPKIHDAIMGPVEEFLTPDRTGLGYEEVKPGENFVKIGVGAIRRPDEPRFQQFKTYEIADHGKWKIRSGADFVEFTQELKDTAGYAYLYTKTLRLTKGKPEMTLDHRLRNTGKKAIDSNVYEHDFYMLDGLPTGPDVSVKFPFDLRATRELSGMNMAAVRGKEFVYTQELPKGPSVSTWLEGFGDSPKDYDIRVENRKCGCGVRQTGDRPIAQLLLWSIRTTVCPEAYIHFKVEPGKEFTWRIAYEFYTF
jgi:hypothetical protein